MAAFTQDTLTLLTKEYPEGGNIFVRIGRWFKKYDESKLTLFDPIETILKVLRSVLNIPYTRKMIRGLAPRDDVYGEYPKLLVNFNILPREKIIPFLEEIFPLNGILTVEQRKVAEELEHLCLTKLHVATVRCFFLISC